MTTRPHPTKGPGWWQIVISHGRKQKQEVIVFQGLEAEAEAFEAELRGIPADDSKAKVKDLTARFFDWYGLHRGERTTEECKRAFKNILLILGDRHVALLRQSDYDKYKTYRLGTKVVKRTVNLELSYFRSFLTWCKEEQKIEIGEKPKMFPKKQTQPKHRSFPLTSKELRALIAEVRGADKKTIVMLYAYCGLRRNEALHLKRSQVNLESRILVVTGKGEKTRIVPIISEDLVEALKAICEGKKEDAYLFISKRTEAPYRNIKHAIKNAARRAGIKKDVWNHLLRHTFGTSSVAAGVNLPALQSMLGHSDIRTTQIYIHMAAEMLQTEAAKLAAWHKTSEMSETETDKKDS